MKRAFSIAALAAFVFLGNVAVAQDTRKAPAVSVDTTRVKQVSRTPAKRSARAPAHRGLSAIEAECVKQQGGYFDPATKRWQISFTRDIYNFNRTQGIYRCVEQRTGKPSRQFMKEKHTVTQ